MLGAELPAVDFQPRRVFADPQPLAQEQQVIIVRRARQAFQLAARTDAAVVRAVGDALAVFARLESIDQPVAGDEIDPPGAIGRDAFEIAFDGRFAQREGAHDATRLRVELVHDGELVVVREHAIGSGHGEARHLAQVRRQREILRAFWVVRLAARQREDETEGG